MNSLAVRLARFIWWWCLWFMRRPLIKAMQRRAFFPGGWGKRARESFIRQNRFARRNGVAIIATILNLFIGYVVVLVVYISVLTMNENGWLSPPDSIVHRMSR